MSVDQDSYNKSGLLIFIISMVGVMLFFMYLVFVHPGVEGIDKIVEPSEKAAKQEVAKVEAVDPESVNEPWAVTDGLVAAGAKVYALNCAACHGATGKGDGVAATAETRNLVAGNWKAGGASIDLFKTLQKGLPGTGMVSFKASVSKNNRWALVHFIRSITENKPEDDADKLKDFAATAD